MGWFDPLELKFDISKISSMRTKLQAIETDLSALSEELLGEVEDLKQSWKTPAGEVFFEKFDTGWGVGTLSCNYGLKELFTWKQSKTNGIVPKI